MGKVTNNPFMGFLLGLFFKPDTLAPLAAIIGILFTGLLSMTAAVTPMSQSEAFANLFVNLSHTPILGFLAGIAVAFMIQSSSATIGILQALSTTGVLTFSSVYSIIIGVNIGDCVTTAIVCAIGSKADAKRTGLIHVIFNLFALLLVVVGVTVFHALGLLDGIWDATITSGGIANTHSLFRLVCAVALLPFVNTFEKMSYKLVKDDKLVGESVEAELAQMDEKLFSSPALALSSASNVIATMARLANTGVIKAMGCLTAYGREVIEKINENENRLDVLADNIDVYLLHLAPHMSEGPMYDKLSYYTQCFSELERIADQCSNIGLFTLSLKNPQVMSSHHDYTRYLHSGQDEFFNETCAVKREKYFGRLEALDKE